MSFCERFQTSFHFAHNQVTIWTQGTTVQEWRKQSFDFTADSTKQLITVAAGVVTATVLFSKDLDAISRGLAYASGSR